MQRRYLWFNSKIITFILLTIIAMLIVFMGFYSEILILIISPWISFTSTTLLLTQSQKTRSLMFSSALTAVVVFVMSYRVWITFKWPPNLWEVLNSWMIFIILSATVYEIIYYLSSSDLRRRFMSGYRFLYNGFAVISSLTILYVRFNLQWLWPALIILMLVWLIITGLLVNRLGDL